MKRSGAFLLAVAAASIQQDSSCCHAQDYDYGGQYEENYGDYADGQDDNLYADYAAKQQQKAVNAAG
jgi:hypothetical protein